MPGFMDGRAFTCARCLRELRRDEPVVPVGVDRERMVPNYACADCWTEDERAEAENPTPRDYFEEAMGSYAGPADQTALWAAMRDHVGPRWVRVTDANGAVVVQARIPQEVEQHMGGFRARFEDGGVLDLVMWHEVWHETESGDLAPGFPAFTVELTERDEEGEG